MFTVKRDCCEIGYQRCSQTKTATRRFEQQAHTESSHTIQRLMAIQVLKKFRHLFRLTKSHSSMLQMPTRVTRAEMWALCELREHPGMMMTKLAEAMALHQSTVSNLINKLLHRQLVSRKRDDMDARVVHLYLTAVGERVVIETPPAPHNALLDTLEDLSVKTLRLLDRELAALLHRAQR